MAESLLFINLFLFSPREICFAIVRMSTVRKDGAPSFQWRCRRQTRVTKLLPGYKWFHESSFLSRAAAAGKQTHRMSCYVERIITGVTADLVISLLVCVVPELRKRLCAFRKALYKFELLLLFLSVVLVEFFFVFDECRWWKCLTMALMAAVRTLGSWSPK